MDRKACLLLLTLFPFLTGAGRIVTTVTLDRSGCGTLTSQIRCDLEKFRLLLPAADLQRIPLVRQVAASPDELASLLSSAGINDVSVKQTLRKGVRTTEAQARFDDVRSIRALIPNSRLTFVETPQKFLELKGTFGGKHSRPLSDRELAALDEIDVELTISFPGTVTRTDSHGKPSYSGTAVTYGWTAKELLTSSTAAEVRVVPDIEGSPYYWLAMILVVTGLVVSGAFIVLQRGRGALEKPSEN